jgi:hypothetical protein
MTLNEEYKEKLDVAPLFTVICDDTRWFKYDWDKL